MINKFTINSLVIILFSSYNIPILRKNKTIDKVSFITIFQYKQKSKYAKFFNSCACIHSVRLIVWRDIKKSFKKIKHCIWDEYIYSCAIYLYIRIKSNGTKNQEKDSIHFLVDQSAIIKCYNSKYKE